MSKDMKRLQLRLPSNNPIFMVNSEERSKKADEWLQMGAKIERLELAIVKLERLLSQNSYVHQPEIPKDKKKEMEKRDIRLIKSILGED